MALVCSFPPVEPPVARCLILGSMPGVRSLDEQQYYAHPRNAFWPIMAQLLGFEVTLPYAERLQALQGAGIGLWDVLQACVRPGSLDSDIVESTIVPNDFGAWFERHPSTQALLFNGGKAWQSYRRHVLPRLPVHWAALPCQVLPSTSPAHAALGLSEKMQQWRAALADFLPPAD